MSSSSETRGTDGGIAPNFINNSGEASTGPSMISRYSGTTISGNISFGKATAILAFSSSVGGGKSSL